jgi:hypothetical protein
MGTKRLIFTTLMFAFSMIRHANWFSRFLRQESGGLGLQVDRVGGTTSKRRLIML